MNIILLADNRKYDLLVNLCIAYTHIFEKHQLLSLFNIAHLIKEHSGLNIQSINADVAAGGQQLASLANYNEVDAVIYLRDPQAINYASGNDLLRACDINIIPYATNLASAEVLVMGIERGDLDWRTLI